MANTILNSQYNIYLNTDDLNNTYILSDYMDSVYSFNANSAFTFSGCQNLSIDTRLDFSLNNVINGAHMFEGAAELGYSFNDQRTITNNIINMHKMFLDCQSTSISLPNMQTYNITDMSKTFSNSSVFTDEDSKLPDIVTNLHKTFYQTSIYGNIPLMSPNVIDASYSYAFTGISGNNNYIVNAPNVKNLASAFSSTYDLNKIVFAKETSSHVTDMSYMFAKSSLRIADNIITPYDNINYTNMTNNINASHLYDSTAISSYNLGFNTATNTGRIIDASYMYFNCTNLTTTSDNLNDDSLVGIKNAAWMFYGCKNFRPNNNLKIANIPISLENASHMFDGTGITTAGCMSNLTTAGALRDASYMFANSNITSLSFFNNNNFDVTTVSMFANLRNMEGMFANCINLTSDQNILLNCNDAFYNKAGLVKVNNMLAGIPNNIRINIFTAWNSPFYAQLATSTCYLKGPNTIWLTSNGTCYYNKNANIYIYYNSTNAYVRNLAAAGTTSMYQAYSNLHSSYNKYAFCPDSCTNMAYAFCDCNALQNVYPSLPPIGNHVINLNHAYYNTSLYWGTNTINLGNYPNITDMNSAFGSSADLTYGHFYTNIILPTSLNNNFKASGLYQAFSMLNNLRGAPICSANTSSLYRTYCNCYKITGSPVAPNNVHIVNRNIIEQCPGFENAYTACYNLTGNAVMPKFMVEQIYRYNYNNYMGDVPEDLQIDEWNYFNHWSRFKITDETYCALKNNESSTNMVPRLFADMSISFSNMYSYTRNITGITSFPDVFYNGYPDSDILPNYERHYTKCVFNTFNMDYLHTYEFATGTTYFNAIAQTPCNHFNTLYAFGRLNWNGWVCPPTQDNRVNVIFDSRRLMNICTTAFGFDPDQFKYGIVNGIQSNDLVVHNNYYFYCNNLLPNSTDTTSSETYSITDDPTLTITYRNPDGGESTAIFILKQQLCEMDWGQTVDFDYEMTDSDGHAWEFKLFDNTAEGISGIYLQKYRTSISDALIRGVIKWEQDDYNGVAPWDIATFDHVYQADLKYIEEMRIWLDGAPSNTITFIKESEYQPTNTLIDFAMEYDTTGQYYIDQMNYSPTYQVSYMCLRSWSTTYFLFNDSDSRGALENDYIMGEMSSYNFSAYPLESSTIQMTSRSGGTTEEYFVTPDTSGPSMTWDAALAYSGSYNFAISDQQEIQYNNGGMYETISEEASEYGSAVRSTDTFTPGGTYYYGTGGGGGETLTCTMCGSTFSGPEYYEGMPCPYGDGGYLTASALKTFQCDSCYVQFTEAYEGEYWEGQTCPNCGTGMLHQV